MTPSVFGQILEYSDDIDLINRVLSIYTTAVNGGKDNEGKTLRPRLVTVLAFYVVFGYSNSTRKLILDTLGIKATNLNVLNHTLTEIGYLVRDTRNFRVKHLSQDLVELRKYFLEDSSENILLLKFKKK